MAFISIESNDAVYSGCKEIEKITIHEGVTEIQPKAFENCTNVKKIIVPTSLKKIGYDAFNGCDHIEEVLITSLSSWMAIDFDNDFSISNPLSCGAKLMLNNTLVEEVEVPEDIRIIGLAFHRYNYIKKLKMHQKVTSVKENAFFWCKHLSYVELSSRLLFIGTSTFEMCENLKEIIMPIGIETIGERAFKGCKALTSITFPDTLYGIEKEAFSHTGLTDLIIMSTIKELGEKCFCNCKELRSITIENRKILLGRALFSGCEELKEIHLPEDIDYLSSEMFSCCNLQDFKIPNSVQMLASRVLVGNPIKALFIPDSVNQLDCGALMIGKEFQEVSLPGFIEMIDKDAFGREFIEEDKMVRVVVRGHEFSSSLLDCLKENNKCLDVVFSDALSSEVPMQYRKHMTEYWINKVMNHQEINKEIFVSFSKYLKSHKKDWLFIPNLDKNCVFRFMMREKYITAQEIDELIKQASEKSDPELLAALIDYQNHTFSFEDYEKEFEKELKRIEKVTTNQLTPGTQEYINRMWTVSRSRPYVNKLKHTESIVYFPERVGNTTINGLSDKFSFQLDNKSAINIVKEVFFPDSYTYIGNLDSRSCQSGLKIHVSSIEQWLKMRLNYYLPCNTRLIIGNSNVKEITIPGLSRQIGNFAFANIQNIESYIIEEGIEEIGRYAFSDTNIRSIVLPATVKTIDDFAFLRCNKLKTIRFQGIPQYIARSALMECQIVVVANEVTNEMLSAIPYGTLIFTTNYKTVNHYNRYRARPIEEYDEISMEKNGYFPLRGMIFAITGNSCLFSERGDLIQFIKSCGGEYTSSVTKKTNCLLTNLKSATTVKYMKAKEYDIMIIDEESLLDMIS